MSGEERTQKLEELAKLGLSFKQDTLMVQFFVAIGRAEEMEHSDLNQRRITTAVKMDRLKEELWPGVAWSELLPDNQAKEEA